MARIRIDRYGIKMYLSDVGKIHRDDGPAIIRPNGEKWYYHNGKVFRPTGPSVISVKGDVLWRIGTSVTRTDGPAFDNPNGKKRWWYNGKRQWPKL